MNLFLCLLLAATADERAYELGKQIRCPVCQGMPIAESPSQMAQDMMKEVHSLTQAQKTDEEIKQYFTSRYGDWVLLSPKPQGFNLLVWILPPVGLLLGLWWVFKYLKKHRL